MSTSAFFWDRIANNYSKQPVADEAAYQKKLDVTQEYFSADSRVLEFGCGTGTTAIYHASKVNHILATDISARMLQIAKAKALQSDIGNICFEQTSLLELDCPDASWDAVLGMSILHLLPDWEAHISRVFSLLKPGGVFISSTACIADMAVWFRVVAPVFRGLPVLPNVQGFSCQTLKDALTAAGFGIDYEWRPGADKAVFIVARKPGI